MPVRASLKSCWLTVAWTGKYTTAEETAEGVRVTAHVDAASSQAIFDTDRIYNIRVDLSP